jgi:phospholipid:diacylglycerol acyltransferase
MKPKKAKPSKKSDPLHRLSKDTKDLLSKLHNEAKTIDRQKKIIYILLFLVGTLTAVVIIDYETNDVILPAFKDHILLPGLDLTDRFVNSYFYDDDYPGISLAQNGMEKKHPVVMIPGFVTTGLELWEGENCAKRYFRQRMWGTLSMMNSMIRDPQCWLRHMSLDWLTGMDPPGIKLRPANGLEAADYLFPGYWVWGKLIENLAFIGYDSNDIYMASFDWRLALNLNQKRDQYFDKLKANIELLHKRTNHKVVIVTHSMGALVALNFMKFADESTANKNWVDQHVDSLINVGGPLLGVAKSISSFISGEMKDTTNFITLQSYILDPIISKEDRAHAMRTWLSVASMFPKGGEKIWGSDSLFTDSKDGNYISLRGKDEKSEWRNMTADQAIEFVYEILSSSKLENDNQIAKNLKNWYSHGVATRETGFQGTVMTVHKNVTGEPSDRTHISQNKKFWANPLETPLPYAPKMKIYCVYGVDKDTERGYIYEHRKQNDSLPYSMDVLYSKFEEGIVAGVRHTNGDGTVPLLSLGYMCVNGWKNNFYNPSGTQIITREFKHDPNLLVRGGSKTGDHVDIMGNYKVTMDILNIVSGSTESDEDIILSDIIEISKRINLP